MIGHAARRASRFVGACAGLLAMASLSTAACAQSADAKADGPGPIAIHGNITVFEIAPVLLAADKYYPGQASVKMGGIANLVGEQGVPGFGSDGVADAATHAETQALRYSVRHPDVRIIMTITEGLYRIVARKSAGIAKLSDLKGKRIATIAGTSAGFFVQKMMKGVGLSTADVTMVAVNPLTDMPKALAEGKVDAVAIWEPEVEKAAQAIGPDAIEFSGKGIYRELFNLNSTAGNLADPVKRRKIVAFVQAVIKASADLKKDPSRAQQLMAQSSKYPLDVVQHSWSHHAYIAAFTDDLLDVLVEEEAWLAAMDKRPARTRAQLAPLIDMSVYKEAMTGLAKGK